MTFSMGHSGEAIKEHRKLLEEQQERATRTMAANTAQLQALTHTVRESALMSVALSSR